MTRVRKEKYISTRTSGIHIDVCKLLGKHSTFSFFSRWLFPLVLNHLLDNLLFPHQYKNDRHVFETKLIKQDIFPSSPSSPLPSSINKPSLYFWGFSLLYASTLIAYGWWLWLQTSWWIPIITPWGEERPEKNYSSCESQKSWLAVQCPECWHNGFWLGQFALWISYL